MIVLRKVWTVMTLMMKLNSKRRERSTKKRQSQPFRGSTKVFVKLLMMIQCYSKMKSSPSSLLKERFGQILRSPAVLPSSHKDHIITLALLSATPLAPKRDLPWIWQAKVRVHKLNSRSQSRTLVTFSSTSNKSSQLELKILVKSIATGS